MQGFNNVTLQRAIELSKEFKEPIRAMDYDGKSAPGPWLMIGDDGYLVNQSGLMYRLSLQEINSKWEIRNVDLMKANMILVDERNELKILLRHFYNEMFPNGNWIGGLNLGHSKNYDKVLTFCASLRKYL